MNKSQAGILLARSHSLHRMGGHMRHVTAAFVCGQGEKLVPRVYLRVEHAPLGKLVREIKACNNPISVAPTDKVLGAQVCAWSQPEALELPGLRQRVPAMSERVWSPDAGRTFADFSKRLNATDAALTKLLEKENGSQCRPSRHGRNRCGPDRVCQTGPIFLLGGNGASTGGK